MATPALDEVVDFLSAGENLVGRARRPSEREGRRLLPLEEARERLEMLDEGGALGAGQDVLPPRHRRARHPDVDDVQEVLVGRELTRGGGADLIECRGEVAGPR